jgi:hypothetical protein
MPRITKLAMVAVASLAALALVASAPAGAQPSAKGEKCGKHVVNGGGWWKLKAKNVSCKGARKLADHFVFKAGGVDDRFHDWVCAKAQIGDEVWTVQCSREKGTKTQEVTFEYGA